MTPRHATPTTRSRLIVALALSSIALCTGCSSELDPTNPEDAYVLFRDAMFAGDTSSMWDRLDDTSQAFFQKNYDGLEEMQQTIDMYLPQADHRLAKRQSGAVLLRDVKDGKTLFVRIFNADKIPKTEAHKLGSDVSEVELAEDEASAKVITKSAQSYVMVKGKREGVAEEQWYVMLPESSKEVRQSLAWVQANQTALKQTVDDLIAEERTRRERVIADLLKKSSPN